MLRILGRNSRASAGETDGACAEGTRETRGKKRKRPSQPQPGRLSAEAGLLAGCNIEFVQKIGFSRITTDV